MKTKLEVGDKVLIKSPYGSRIVTIDRVTKTKACAKNVDFKREVPDGENVERWCKIRFDIVERKLIKNK
jgi:hypothetical protein